MGTNYIAPIWRMPRNANNTPVDKLSNYSMEFDAGTSSQAINCGTSDNVDITGPISISVWFNASALSSSRGIVCKNDNVAQQTSAQYFFDILNGDLRWRAGRSTVTYTIQADQWYHAVGVYDGSNTTLYIDGAQVATTAASASSYQSNEPMYIGRRLAQSYFGGRIAQVCIFDYALSIDQRNYLYNLNNPMAITGAEPVAYWPLGDNSNPNANAGYPNISVGADSVFDFIPNDYINLGENVVPATPAWTALTVSAWVKKDATGTYGRVIGKDDGGSNRVFLLQVQSNDKLSGSIRTVGGGSWDNVQTTTDVTIGEWQHVAMTYTANGLIRLYINGQVEASGSTSIANLNPATTDTLIGAKGNITNMFDGQISNVQIWDVEISPAEMLEVYNNGQPLMTGTQPQEASLKASYKLNQSEIYNEAQLSNWTISRIGNPNYGGSNDGCYSVNPGLRWHDNNFDTVSSDYFQWNSPTYKTTGTNIVLSSSGGEWVSTINGNEIVLEYSIDGGAWTLWHQELNPGFTGSTPVTFSIPSTSNLTVNDNIRVRVKGVDYGSTSPAFTYIQLYNIQLSGGTLSYNENFNESQRYGWFSNNGGLQPPTEYIEDPYWEIQNSASPYSKSFKINGVEPNADDIVSYSQGRKMTGETGTVSAWVRLNKNAFGLLPAAAYYPDAFTIVNFKGFASREHVTLVVNKDGSFGKAASSWSPQGSAYSSTGLIEEDEWYHIAMVQTGSGVDPQLYLNGELVTVATTGGNSSYWWGNFNPVAPRNPQVYKWGIGSFDGTYQSANAFDGIISNVLVWNTGLSVSDIQEVYNNGIPLANNTVSPASLVIDMPLDKTSEWYGTAEFGHVNVDDWVFKNKVLGPSNTIECLGFSGSNQDTLGKEKFELDSTVTGENILLTWWLKSTGSPSAPFTWENQTTYGIRLRSGYIYVYGKNGGYVYNRNYHGDYAWHQYSILIPNTNTFTSTDIKLWVDNTQVAGPWSVSNPTTFDKIDINGFNIAPLAYEQTNSECLYANWAVIPNFDDSGANLDTLWNNGAPGDLSVFNPAVWYKLNSTDVSFNTTGSYELQITDSSSNGNNATGPYDYDNAINQKPRIVSDTVLNGIGSNNTEENQLVNRYVSTLNGESVGMNSTNLVTSNLTRKQPFSSYSFNFDGTSEIEISQFTLSGAFTLSVWLNADTFTGGQAMLFGDNDSNGYKIEFNGTTTISIKNAGGNTSFTGSAWNINEWQHLLISRDTLDNIVIYRNGTSWSTGTKSGDILFDRISGFNSSASHFNGKLSNCCLFDKNLSEQEILKIYNNGVTQNLQATSSFSNNITAWWPMDEHSSYYDGTDWVIRDIENGNDGTGANTGNVDDLVGNAPGSEANGSGTNLAIADLKGDMKDSKHNAYSINMGDYADSVVNPANSGRSIEVP